MIWPIDGAPKGPAARCFSEGYASVSKVASSLISEITNEEGRYTAEKDR